ncbi:MAG TPA: hypothetical protein PLP88_10935 [Bacteroidales bacterium]|nr:hypothetical protein [Bacteroidales bacterium]
MKRFLALFIVGVTLYGCSGSDQKADNPNADPAKDPNKLVISNDLENAAAIIPSWSNEKTVVKMDGAPAHSGQFVSLIDDQFQYSYGFHETIGNLNKKLPKKVTVKGWIYSSIAAPDISIVMDINDNGKQVEWKAYSLTPVINEANKWIEYKANFDITKPIQASYLIKCFAWNPGKKLAYLDDFEITIDY